MSPLVVRSNSSSQVGAGHSMRCLALAQAWLDVARSASGGSAAERVVFVGEQTHTVAARLQLEDIECLPPSASDDARHTRSVARRAGASWIVVDGYGFTAEMLQDLRADGARVLLVDDVGTPRAGAADAVLNHNPHARRELYPTVPEEKLLLGLRFALLRREFRSAPPPDAESGRGGILISMGGADPQNITCAALEGVLGLAEEGEQVRVVTTREFPHRAALEALRGRVPGRVEVLTDVADMASLLRRATLAVAAGGGTVWELACLRVPALAISRGQQETVVLEECARQGLVRYLGELDAETPTRVARATRELLGSAALREEVAAQAHRCVDGQGAARVVESLRAMQGRQG